jgi:hypothetical protein
MDAVFGTFFCPQPLALKNSIYLFIEFDFYLLRKDSVSKEDIPHKNGIEC